MPDTPLNQDALDSLIEQVQEAIDHVHLDPREFFDLSDVLYHLKAAALPEVTSVEELEALPVGSVLMELSGAGRAGVKSRVNGVFFAEELSEHMTFQVALPARVLHRPEVNDV